MFEIIGWIGAVAFAVSAIPQAWASFKQGHSEGVSPLFLALWLTGELCMILYSQAILGSWQLLFNYVFNLLCLLVIIWYKIKPR